MTNAYKAILTMLEDKKHGLGAKEIIGYGFSIGGGVQGDALRTHHLKSDVKYTFVKDRTFSSFSSITSSLLHHSVGFIVWFFGWNFSSRRSSMNLKAPEVIIQRAEVTRYTDIQTKRELIVDDGIITPKASLAGRLLRDKHSTYENKSFVGVPEDHNTDLENVRHITRLIESKLASA